LLALPLQVRPQFIGNGIHLATHTIQPLTQPMCIIGGRREHEPLSAAETLFGRLLKQHSHRLVTSRPVLFRIPHSAFRVGLFRIGPALGLACFMATCGIRTPQVAWLTVCSAHGETFLTTTSYCSPLHSTFQLDSCDPDPRMSNTSTVAATLGVMACALAGSLVGGHPSSHSLPTGSSRPHFQQQLMPSPLSL
jgi:hypothetical protein